MPLFAQGSADVGKHTKKQLGKSYHGNVATYRDYQKTNIRKYFPGGLGYKGHLSGLYFSIRVKTCPNQ